MRTADAEFTTDIEAISSPSPLGGSYATGDAIGQLWNFPSCVRSNGSFLLVDLTVIDPSNSKIAIDFLLFRGQPAASTDSSAPTLSLYDSVCIAIPQITSSDTWVTVGSEAGITKSGLNICRKINQAELYFLPVARGTLTATKLRIIGGFIIS